MKFRVDTEKENEETGKMEIDITEMCIKQETVYGGVDALKLYSKYNTVIVVLKYEDSGVTIKIITLTNIYIYIYTCFEKKSKHIHKF